MPLLPGPVQERRASWSPTAQDAFDSCRALFLQAAEELEIGALEESLKWGQPAWRPQRARTGSTLRMGWDPDLPDRLSLYVDCKTDLAARMAEIYPHLPGNDGRRRIALALGAALPQEAVQHLAEMTFTYHRAKRTQPH